jgi:ABC-type Fe3+ transport system permease subunit
MKQVTKATTFKSFVTFLLLSLVQTIVWAQDSTTSSTTTRSTDVKITEGSENWYASPWVWIIGAALFILLLVALTRGGGRRGSDTTSSDRVTVTKTVKRDTDVDPGV